MRTRLAAFGLALWIGVGSAAPEPARPKNVILLIGDGMGVGALMQFIAAKGDKVLTRFPRGALVLTQPLNEDRWVTDSAAAATAMATGEKTLNGLLSLRPKASGFDTLRTIVEEAEARGKATGIVVTCQVTHATPAAFYAHASRSQEGEIAIQLLDSGLDVVLGGGTSFFLPVGEGEGRREDGRNLLNELRRRGYHVITDTLEFRRAGVPLPVPVIGLFAPVALAPPPERRPTLAQMVAKAIATLRTNPRGFFLMVEGSQIDWAAHSNDAARELEETQDFVAAVEVALDFATADGNTLVIVTADHDTGGLAVTGGDRRNRQVEVRYVGGEHTANPAPFFAFGPGSDRFPGMMANDFIGKVLMEFVRQQ
jgi:alkaline phosphatase